MGSTNCMIEYIGEDIFHLDLDEGLFHPNNHQPVEKITLDGVEYEAIIPNRNWCCSSGYSAWKCTENDILIKTEEHGWIQCSKPKELCKKFTYIHFSFKDKDINWNEAWSVMSEVEEKYNIDRKYYRINYMENWYIIPSEETERIKNIFEELNIHTKYFSDINTHPHV